MTDKHKKQKERRIKAKDNLSLSRKRLINSS